MCLVSSSRHLATRLGLRRAGGDRFVAGVALHLGPLGYTAEDRIHVCPADRLWS